MADNGETASSIALLSRLAPGVAVRVRGRCLRADEDGSVFVRDESGGVWAHCATAVPAPGAWVRLQGPWNGQAIEAARVHVLREPQRPFPDPEGDWAWLQDAGGRRAELLRSRAALLRETRAFFDGRDFLEVETPSMVPSPGLDVHLEAFEVAHGDDWRYLITSPEYQMKRLLSGGLPRIYQLCKCFRRGESGTFHEPEFTMLEWYRTFAGSDEVMGDTEHLLAHLARSVHRGSTVIPARGRPIDVRPPWERLTVREAFERYADTPMDELVADEERFFRVLLEQVEPHLGVERPVFLVGWPATMASLARLDPDDPSIADRFEAYVDGVELCNGFGELTDPDEQRDRLRADRRRRRALGKSVYPIDERFLGALEEGMPPSGGNALGFDRLVMMVLGIEAVEDVMAIPAARL